MIMFGGLIYITKESNETLKYDSTTNSWQQVKTAIALTQYGSSDNNVIDATSSRIATEAEEMSPGLG